MKIFQNHFGEKLWCVQIIFAIGGQVHHWMEKLHIKYFMEVGRVSNIVGSLDAHVKSTLLDDRTKEDPSSRRVFLLAIVK